MQTLSNVKNRPDAVSRPAASFGFYADLAKARNISDLHRRIGIILKRLNFTDYSFIQLARADLYQKSLCSLSKILMHAYYDANLFVNDMTLQKAINSTEPFFRSLIHEYVANAPFTSDMTRCMDNIYKLNKSHGYYDYYHIPSRFDENSDPVLLSVTQRGTSPVELKKTVQGSETSLVILCEAIDFVLKKHFPNQCYVSKKFTSINPKPLRVLETLANNDMTIEQVADKLSISVVTANQHLKTVRNSLSTRTNYAAIKRAVLENLIKLEKPLSDECLPEEHEHHVTYNNIYASHHEVANKTHYEQE